MFHEPPCFMFIVFSLAIALGGSLLMSKLGEIMDGCSDSGGARTRSLVLRRHTLYPLSYTVVRIV